MLSDSSAAEFAPAFVVKIKGISRKFYTSAARWQTQPMDAVLEGTLGPSQNRQEHLGHSAFWLELLSTSPVGHQCHRSLRLGLTAINDNTTVAGAVEVRSLRSILWA